MECDAGRQADRQRLVKGSHQSTSQINGLGSRELIISLSSENIVFPSSSEHNKFLSLHPNPQSISTNVE